MTIPRGIGAATRKVSDMVRDMFPHLRMRTSPEENRLAIHLRGNMELLESLKGVIQTRIGGRANLPVPTDPLICKAILERDNELRWLISRLEFLHRSPVAQPADDSGEPPA